MSSTILDRCFEESGGAEAIAVQVYERSSSSKRDSARGFPKSRVPYNLLRGCSTTELGGPLARRSFVFGVDLDGTCADFYGGLRPIAAEWLGVPLETLPEHVSWGLPEWGIDKAPGGYERLHRFAVTQKNLFRSLNPMPGAPIALRRLSGEGVRIRIITHRLFIKYFHEIAVRQTIEWLDSHDIPYWDLCFMHDKAAVGADLYIEDSPDNIQKLRADGHPTIVFSNSTNLELPGPRADSWDDVIDHVTDALAMWHASNSDEAELPGA
jgi:5'(3')-deoxyribonucleotidase